SRSDPPRPESRHDLVDLSVANIRTTEDQIFTANGFPAIDRQPGHAWSNRHWVRRGPAPDAGPRDDRMCRFVDPTVRGELLPCAPGPPRRRWQTVGVKNGLGRRLAVVATLALALGWSVAAAKAVAAIALPAI